ncbi:winged helix-turn-helix transcriptional regulator [Mucilaginibacter sp. Mucisp84]|uniref:winged helix-turn-helix transcriptional regulator n=1 Tax=Mucilaginibacter sp. Mucisp84 TaxID=3243058 RepID=UPI0039A6D22B
MENPFVVLYIARDQQARATAKKYPGSIRRVLNIQLNQLEDDELVAKTVYNQQPPKVEYYLTDLGKSIMPIINELGRWGDTHSGHLRRVIKKRLILPDA